MYTAQFYPLLPEIFLLVAVLFNFGYVFVVTFVSWPFFVDFFFYLLRWLGFLSPHTIFFRSSLATLVLTFLLQAYAINDKIVAMSDLFLFITNFLPV